MNSLGDRPNPYDGGGVACERRGAEQAAPGWTAGCGGWFSGYALLCTC